MFDFLWDVVTFLPWLVTQLIAFVWSICTSIIGFAFAAILFIPKTIVAIVASVFLFFFPGEATATSPSTQVSHVATSSSQISISHNTNHEAQKILDSMERLAFLGLTMSRKDSAACLVEMRENQSRVSRLGEKLDQLGQFEAKFLLKSALTDLDRCVSCFPTATDACERLNFYFQGAKDLL